MSRGTNSWDGSGDVISDVLYSQTSKGEKAASFKLAINQAHKSTVFVRINVYGGNVDVIKERGLKKGDFVVIGGELMNRRGQGGSDWLTEIRCGQVVLPQLANKDGNYAYKEGNQKEEV